MKCASCDKEFFSMEWYRANMEDLVMCDDCVLYVWKTRKEIKQNEIRYIDRKIKELECKTTKSR